MQALVQNSKIQPPLLLCGGSHVVLIKVILEAVKEVCVHFLVRLWGLSQVWDVHQVLLLAQLQQGHVVPIVFFWWA